MSRGPSRGSAGDDEALADFGTIAEDTIAQDSPPDFGDDAEATISDEGLEGDFEGHTPMVQSGGARLFVEGQASSLPFDDRTPVQDGQAPFEEHTPLAEPVSPFADATPFLEKASGVALDEDAFEEPTPFGDQGFGDEGATVSFDEDNPPDAFGEAATLGYTAETAPPEFGDAPTIGFDEEPTAFGDEEATAYDASEVAPPARRPRTGSAAMDAGARGVVVNLGRVATPTPSLPPERATEPPDPPKAPTAPRPSTAKRKKSVAKKRAGSASSDDFGRYTLGPPVGSGGMAEVRLGYEQLPDGRYRPCVIKRIAREYAKQQKYREMFFEEVRLSRILRHPNVVGAYGDGELDGVPYIVFELVDGVTLKEFKRLAGDKLPPSVVAELALGVAKGLAYAHNAVGPDGEPLKLVHRDVSPQNILISRDVEVKLVDFGIARFEGRMHSTMSGEVKGKMKYMALEQLAEKPVDGRTDLFALGIVMGEALDLLQSGFTEHFVSGLVEQPGNCPLPLYELMKRFAAPKKDGRPPSAEAAIRELEKVLAALPDRVPLAEFAAEKVFPNHASVLKRTAAPGQVAMPAKPKPKPKQEATDFDDFDDDNEATIGYAEFLAAGAMPALPGGGGPEAEAPTPPPSPAPTRKRTPTPDPAPARQRTPTPAPARQRTPTPPADPPRAQSSGARVERSRSTPQPGQGGGRPGAVSVSGVGGPPADGPSQSSSGIRARVDPTARIPVRERGASRAAARERTPALQPRPISRINPSQAPPGPSQSGTTPAPGLRPQSISAQMQPSMSGVMPSSSGMTPMPRPMSAARPGMPVTGMGQNPMMTGMGHNPMMTGMGHNPMMGGQLSPEMLAQMTQAGMMPGHPNQQPQKRSTPMIVWILAGLLTVMAMGLIGAIVYLKMGGKG